MANTTVEKQLVDLEKQYWQAMKDKDGDTAMRLTDDSCIVAGPRGVARIEKSAIPAMLTRPNYDLEEFEIKETQVRFLNDDVAVIAYKAHEEISVDGKTVSLDVADSSTWIRRDGSWVCAAHTEAVAGDPYGRDKKDAS